MSKIMLNRIQLAAILSLVAATAYGQGTIGDIEGDANNGSPVKIIEPEKDVPQVRYAAIDDERFELGVYFGALSVADFPTNTIWGGSFTYHINPKWIAQLNYAEAEVGEPYYEEQAGSDLSILRDDRKYSYSSLSAGYRLLTGRSFFGKNDKFNSDIYFVAGVGSTKFHGFRTNSYLIGTSYRIVLTDALVANLDFRTHSVKRDESPNTLDDGERKLNTELSIGLNWLF